jgi:hypothetical protein
LGTPVQRDAIEHTSSCTRCINLYLHFPILSYPRHLIYNQSIHPSFR